MAGEQKWNWEDGLAEKLEEVEEKTAVHVVLGPGRAEAAAAVRPFPARAANIAL